MKIDYQKCIAYFQACIKFQTHIIEANACTDKDMNLDDAQTYYMLSVYHVWLGVISRHIHYMMENSACILYYANKDEEVYDENYTQLNQWLNERKVRDVLCAKDDEYIFPHEMNFDKMYEILLPITVSINKIGEIIGATVHSGRFDNGEFVPNTFGEHIATQIEMEKDHDGYIVTMNEITHVIGKLHQMYSDISEDDPDLEIICDGLELLMTLEK